MHAHTVMWCGLLLVCGVTPSASLQPLGFLRGNAHGLGDTCTPHDSRDSWVVQCEDWCMQSEHCKFCKCKGCATCIASPRFQRPMLGMAIALALFLRLMLPSLLREAHRRRARRTVLKTIEEGNEVDEEWADVVGTAAQHSPAELGSEAVRAMWLRERQARDSLQKQLLELQCEQAAAQAAAARAKVTAHEGEEEDAWWWAPRQKAGEGDEGDAEASAAAARVARSSAVTPPPHEVSELRHMVASLRKEKEALRAMIRSSATGRAIGSSEGGLDDEGGHGGANCEEAGDGCGADGDGGGDAQLLRAYRETCAAYVALRLQGDFDRATYDAHADALAALHTAGLQEAYRHWMALLLHNEAPPAAVHAALAFVAVGVVSPPSPRQRSTVRVEPALAQLAGAVCSSVGELLEQSPAARAKARDAARRHQQQAGALLEARRQQQLAAAEEARRRTEANSAAYDEQRPYWESVRAATAAAAAATDGVSGTGGTDGVRTAALHGEELVAARRLRNRRELQVLLMSVAEMAGLSPHDWRALSCGGLQPQELRALRHALGRPGVPEGARQLVALLDAAVAKLTLPAPIISPGHAPPHTLNGAPAEDARMPFGGVLVLPPPPPPPLAPSSVIEVERAAPVVGDLQEELRRTVGRGLKPNQIRKLSVTKLPAETPVETPAQTTGARLRWLMSWGA